MRIFFLVIAIAGLALAADTSTASSDGTTPLHWAAHNNDAALVDKLLNLPIVREVRSNIAIQTIKAGAPLPLSHLE